MAPHPKSHRTSPQQRSDDPNSSRFWQHVHVDRRQAIQVGAIGILGLGMSHLERLRAAEPETVQSKAKSVIYIFLSGGLGQHDSFDMKPEASEEIRGEFLPIATKTPGTFICEHLPKLAARSEMWSLVRSLTHPYNEHSQGHMVMLSGRTDLPVGFNPSLPRPADHPSIAALAGVATKPRNNLPPAIVLPEKLIHNTGRVIPGQFAGVLGAHRDPYFLENSKYNPKTYGAWPEYGFHHQRGAENPVGYQFLSPSLALPEGLTQEKFAERAQLLEQVQRQQRYLEQLSESASFDRFQQRAVSMITDSSIKELFNVTSADPQVQDRYGRHTFGWSLLLARRLIEAGVNLVQVNLGNNETWDTHGNAFPHLKNYLYPPLDQSLSALLDDLKASGLLEDTLIVMAGEFGRTPKVSRLPEHYALAGRDHWGAAQSVFLAGGGIQGGRVIGETDKIGGRPIKDAVTPENLAATIYRSLGLPRETTWYDLIERPNPLYLGEPIPGLT